MSRKCLCCSALLTHEFVLHLCFVPPLVMTCWINPTRNGQKEWRNGGTAKLDQTHSLSSLVSCLHQWLIANAPGDGVRTLQQAALEEFPSSYKFLSWSSVIRGWLQPWNYSAEDPSQTRIYTSTKALPLLIFKWTRALLLNFRARNGVSKQQLTCCQVTCKHSSSWTRHMV